MPLEGRRNRCAAGRERVEKRPESRLRRESPRRSPRPVRGGFLVFRMVLSCAGESPCLPDRRTKKGRFRPHNVEFSAPRIRAGPHRVCDDRLDRRKRRTVRRGRTWSLSTDSDLADALRLPNVRGEFREVFPLEIRVRRLSDIRLRLGRTVRAGIRLYAEGMAPKQFRHSGPHGIIGPLSAGRIAE